MTKNFQSKINFLAFILCFRLTFQDIEPSEPYLLGKHFIAKLKLHPWLFMFIKCIALCMKSYEKDINEF